MDKEYKMPVNAIKHPEEVACSVNLPYEELQVCIDPSKPPKTRTEYVKVTESIFDLKEEFERGELYYSYAYHNDPETMEPIKGLKELLIEFSAGNLYRRIEKEVDWRSEVISFISEKDINYIDADWCVESCDITSDDFLEMCRIALRVVGELE